jgi:hypothetical protein
MASASVLFDQALELPPDERNELGIRIIMSTADGTNRALSKEEFEKLIGERIREVESGNVETVDAFEVLERARQELRRRS